MRSFWIFLGLLLMPAYAFALSDPTIEYCRTTPDPTLCLHVFTNQSMQERQWSVQLEQARIQSTGMVLFGSGAAFVNGMNQGLQMMQQPYVSTPYFSYWPSSSRGGR